MLSRESKVKLELVQLNGIVKLWSNEKLNSGSE